MIEKQGKKQEGIHKEARKRQSDLDNIEQQRQLHNLFPSNPDHSKRFSFVKYLFNFFFQYFISFNFLSNLILIFLLFF
jgi:hypothetical protein